MRMETLQRAERDSFVAGREATENGARKIRIVERRCGAGTGVAKMAALSLTKIQMGMSSRVIPAVAMQEW